MAEEKRCDVTGRRIVGLDAGEGPMLVKDPSGYVMRVEVIESPPEIQGPPNLRWEGVRKMIEAHTHDPTPEGGGHDDVLDMQARKPA